MTSDANTTANNNDNGSVETTKSSIEQAFAKLWTDEQFHDVTLKANDGTLVTANRAGLATRSNVFTKMLYGNFAEASGGTVTIGGYNGVVLRALMEYIFTDTALVFTMNLDATGRIRTLIDLAGAAVYFDLPALYQKVKACLAGMIDETPALGLYFLEACHQAGPLVPETIQGMTTSVFLLVRLDITKVGPAIKSLSAGVLEKILKIGFASMKESDLFEMLKIWAENDQWTSNETINSSDRHIAALELKKYIRFEHIDPSVLSEVVTMSNLVTSEDLTEAYKKQALSSKVSPDFLWDKPRHTPRWWFGRSKKSCSDTVANFNGFDVIMYPPIYNSKQQWTLQPQGNVSLCSMGLAFLSSVGASDVEIVHYISTSMLSTTSKYSAGSKVTFTLDLGPNQNNGGILAVSVDGGSPITVATNLSTYVKSSKLGGFLPSVQYDTNPACQQGQATVRLLSIKKL